MYVDLRGGVLQDPEALIIFLHGFFSCFLDNSFNYPILKFTGYVFWLLLRPSGEVLISVIVLFSSRFHACSFSSLSSYLRETKNIRVHPSSSPWPG